MIAIQNDKITMVCNPDAIGLTIIDKKRWSRWALDYRTVIHPLLVD